MINKEQGNSPAVTTHVESHIVERNIRALLEKRHKENERKSIEEKIADTVTHFTGSMAFVYIHLVLFIVWILSNVGWFGIKPFDPSFVALQIFISIEAIFLSTFVLITQNRMNVQADKRSDLDLQVSLLSEHEVTRLITLVSAIAKKMNIDEAKDPEINELAQDVMPEKVMEIMELHEADIAKNGCRDIVD